MLGVWVVLAKNGREFEIKFGKSRQGDRQHEVTSNRIYYSLLNTDIHAHTTATANSKQTNNMRSGRDSLLLLSLFTLSKTVLSYSTTKSH